MNSYADFKAVDNLELLQQIIFEEANSDSLVLFDIDDVLISLIDEFNFNSDIRKNLKKTMQQRKGKNEIKEIFSDFFRKRKVKLVNANIVSLLSRIKDQNISASALSAYWTGSFGSIEAMELKRLEEFNQVGISFEDISPFKNDIKFLSCKRELRIREFVCYLPKMSIFKHKIT